jgi:hypothetical protein
MDALDNAFFFVTDKIISLQEFFMGVAWNIGRIVFLVALSMAAINYALTGEGLKNSIVKIGKALVFFVIVMGAYPKIISGITEWTFNIAKESTWDSGLKQEIEQSTEDIATLSEAIIAEALPANPGSDMPGIPDYESGAESAFWGGPLYNPAIDQADLSAFDAAFHNDRLGAPAYSPDVMLKIIFYCYSRGDYHQPAHRICPQI